MQRDVNGPSPAHDAAYLRDMLDACERIARFVVAKSIDDYRRDELLRSAVERQIEILGEAARHLSEAFQAAHSEIPWRAIIAQRHILSHEYGDIEDDLIWRVATIHVPALLEQLQSLGPKD